MVLCWCIWKQWGNCVACITLASDVVFKRLIGYSWLAIGLIVHYKKVPWMLRGWEVPKTPSKYPNDWGVVRYRILSLAGCTLPMSDVEGLWGTEYSIMTSQRFEDLLPCVHVGSTTVWGFAPVCVCQGYWGVMLRLSSITTSPRLRLSSRECMWTSQRLRLSSRVCM